MVHFQFFLLIDPEGGTVLVPGKNRETVDSDIENVRLALPHDSFAKGLQIAIDMVDELIKDFADFKFDFKNWLLIISCDLPNNGDVDFRGSRLHSDVTSLLGISRPLADGDRV